jgi:hypothetical protein
VPLADAVDRRPAKNSSTNPSYLFIHIHRHDDNVCESLIERCLPWVGASRCVAMIT